MSDQSRADVEAEATIVLHDEQKEEYRHQVRRWKWLWVATFAAFATTMVFFLIIMLTMWSTAEHTNRSLDILEEATGPESQSKQGEVIGQLVITIDCNNREAIQELISQLELSEGVNVLPPECLDQTNGG